MQERNSEAKLDFTTQHKRERERDRQTEAGRCEEMREDANTSKNKRSWGNFNFRNFALYTAQ